MPNACLLGSNRSCLRLDLCRHGISGCEYSTRTILKFDKTKQVKSPNMEGTYPTKTFTLNRSRAKEREESKKPKNNYNNLML